MEKKILVFKNNRIGDLFASLIFISTVKNISSNVTLYLSEINIGFSFLFSNYIVKKANYNLTLLDKIKIIYDILVNKYDEVYIISPQKFFFYLPLFFNKIKFYGIVYDGKNRLRPGYFLRKFLNKFEVVYRNNINKFNYKELQLKLIDEKINIDTKFSNLTIPNFSSESKKLIPDKYVFFQFRHLVFDNLNWNLNEFQKIINLLSSKYEYVLFSSDIHKNKRTKYFNNYFEKSFSNIDLNIKKKKIVNNNKVFYLKNLNSKDLFFIIKHSLLSIGKEGNVTHIAHFLNTNCHTLFNFKINSIDDFHHEKISWSEWCRGMNYKFSVLNKNIDKVINKLSKNI